MNDLPAYIREALKLATGKLKPGTVTTVVVAHDDACDCWQGRPCNCDAELRVMQPDAVPV